MYQIMKRKLSDSQQFHKYKQNEEMKFSHWCSILNSWKTKTSKSLMNQIKIYFCYSFSKLPTNKLIN